MSKQAQTELASKSWFLAADWTIESSGGRDFLLATGDSGTVTFVPVWQRGRQVHSWQWLDSRLPSGANLRDIDSQEILDMLSRAWALAWAEVDEKRKAETAARANRPLDDSDIQKAIASVGATRLLRVVAGRTNDPGVYMTYAPENFNIGMLEAGFFPAGLIWLAVDTTGHRVGRRAFRGVDETWALKVLGSAEQVAVRKASRLNRTEQAIAIKDGTFFG